MIDQINTITYGIIYLTCFSFIWFLILYINLKSIKRILTETKIQIQETKRELENQILKQKTNFQNKLIDRLQYIIKQNATKSSTEHSTRNRH